MQETTTLVEVLAASRLIYQHKRASRPPDAALHPLLQRLGVAGAGNEDVSLAQHAEQIAAIRDALMK